VSGVYGPADDAGGGVVFRERRDIAIVSVVARPGGSDALARAAQENLGVEWPGPNESAQGQDFHVLFAGLDRWNVVGEGEEGPTLLARLHEGLGESAALADQSHGLCIIEMAGPRVFDVLAKGTAVDMNPQSFSVGRSVATGANHLAVHLWRVGNDRVMVTVLRSFARDLFEFLSTMSLEYGYRVDAG
jgi:sarcosine oxidase subunit gamma